MVIAKELIVNHMGSVFSDRIKTIFDRRKILYQISKDKNKKGSRSDLTDTDRNWSPSIIMIKAV